MNVQTQVMNVQTQVMNVQTQVIQVRLGPSLCRLVPSDINSLKPVRFFKLVLWYDYSIVLYMFPACWRAQCSNMYACMSQYVCALPLLCIF